MRKSALARVKANEKRQIGTQTIEKAFRREISTQIYLPADRETNTGYSRRINTQRDRTVQQGNRKAKVGIV